MKHSSPIIGWILFMKNGMGGLKFTQLGHKVYNSISRIASQWTTILISLQMLKSNIIRTDTNQTLRSIECTDGFWILKLEKQY